nr:unnamed protein product [Callosobruchus analis]
MFEFFIKNLSDSAIAKHWKGRPKNSSELGDSNTANMPTENIYVKHGQMYEKPARESFISKTGHIVRECGMITSAGDKWLGFSPDGVVLNLDREPIALLEIKCLYSGNYVYYYTIIYNLDNMSPYSFKQHLETKSLACNDMVLCSVFIFHVLHILVYLYLGITMTIKDCLQECNFISKENGRYTLKKKHKYYGQVQLGMGILNLNKCYMCHNHNN